MSINTRIRWSNDGSQMYTYMNTTIPGKTTRSATEKSALDSDMMDGTQWQTTSDGPGGILVQFASPVNLSSIIFKGTGGRTIAFYVSADSTDGFDGAWTAVGNLTTLEFQAQTVTFTAFSNCKWLKLATSNWVNWSEFQIFGEYSSPRFRFFHGGTEYTGEYPLAFPAASNLSAYSEFMDFSIKNMDTATHSYTVTVYAIRYPSETWITGHVKLSTDNGVTKASTIVVSNVAANGGFSETIRVHMDIPISENPTDGWHYFAIGAYESA